MRLVFTEALPVAAAFINGKDTGRGEEFSKTSTWLLCF